jgi:hypothetical protein
MTIQVIFVSTTPSSIIIQEVRGTLSIPGYRCTAIPDVW